MTVLAVRAAWCSKDPIGFAHALTGIVQFLSGCQAPGGGVGGGPGQLPHLAPTYAAVASLVSIGGEHALRAVDRRAVLAFITSMCVPMEQGAGLSMCQGGRSSTGAPFPCPLCCDPSSFAELLCDTQGNHYPCMLDTGG